MNTIQEKSPAAPIQPSAESPKTPVSIAATPLVESKATATEKAPEVQAIEIVGNSVNLEHLTKAINDAKCDAGRLEAMARELGIGQAVKNVQGGANRIVTVSTVRELNRLGKLGGDKAKARIRQDKVIGLNMLVDALTLLGLASRQAE